MKISMTDLGASAVWSSNGMHQPEQAHARERAAKYTTQCCRGVLIKHGRTQNNIWSVGVFVSRA